MSEIPSEPSKRETNFSRDETQKPRLPGKAVNDGVGGLGSLLGLL